MAYYRYKLEVIVLTENEIEGDSLEAIVREGNHGSDRLDWSISSRETLCKKEMADALDGLNSEPDFMLGEDGWKYRLHNGDEVRIDSGQPSEDDMPTVIVREIQYVDDENVIIDTTEGERICCTIDQIL